MNKARDSGTYRIVLVQKVANDKDREAFKALYTVCAPRVKGFLIARRLDATTAEELTQECMLAVWRNASQFDGARGSFDAWLYTIARNALVDHLRRQKRLPLTEQQSVARAPDQGARADDVVAQKNTMDVLSDAMACLPEEQSQVLLQNYFRGLSFRQIAKATNQPLGTIKTRARLGLQRLRNVLGIKAGTEGS